MVCAIIWEIEMKKLMLSILIKIKKILQIRRKYQQENKEFKSLFQHERGKGYMCPFCYKNYITKMEKENCLESHGFGDMSI